MFNADSKSACFSTQIRILAAFIIHTRKLKREFTPVKNLQFDFVQRFWAILKQFTENLTASTISYNIHFSQKLFDKTYQYTYFLVIVMLFSGFGRIRDFFRFRDFVVFGIAIPCHTIG